MPRSPVSGAHATAHCHVVWLSVWFICSRAITLDRRRPVPVGAGHLSWARVSAFSFVLNAHRLLGRICKACISRAICATGNAGRGDAIPSWGLGATPHVCAFMHKKSRKKRLTHTRARARVYLNKIYIYISFLKQHIETRFGRPPPLKLLEKWVKCTQCDKHPLIV